MDGGLRARAVIVSSFIWGTAWSVVAAGAQAVVLLVDHPEGVAVLDLVRPVLHSAAVGAMSGMVAGAAFALGFRRANRGRTLSRLSSSRAAMWGALVGAIVPAFELASALWQAPGPISLRWTTAAIYPLLGAACAVAAVRIARSRAETVLEDGATKLFIEEGARGSHSDASFPESADEASGMRVPRRARAP